MDTQAFPSRGALELLRNTLRRGLGQGVPDRELRRALHMICVEAHTLDLQPEELLVLFKAAWRTLPETQERSAFRQRDLLEHAVTICIDAYYESDSQARG